MDAGQVSVWVPIVVAVLGILGVVSGQLINVWREERRWVREAARDDRRWARERRRDIDAHWRDKRFDVHVSVLAAFRDWERALAEPVAAREAGHEPADLEELVALAARVQEVLSGLMVFGPRSLATSADEVYLEFRQCHDYALGARDLRAAVKRYRYLSVLLLGLGEQVREALQITSDGAEPASIEAG
ncbi:hypothetical protein VSH64_27515 [Amycolatopsis rhabdoformis]|uniref:DUF4760 domain-containing protein n=1 Tax=Amycolatopsis rhabdoformis TaxID=1448059 RepID=A0ABZ1HZ10_9PSEU|nr:hypothetical protein [Amycolatopsis rhabdoformis]WSE26629.1 hypothetical protein VSH64_27515 [Amycolatopsis rhabdoformis]